jgi:hypothetical protein
MHAAQQLRLRTAMKRCERPQAGFDALVLNA